ncbi:hypothetical protein NL676_008948 [Syzygium grande]|nr:hypothetical protein NL676_008948 [Syzygium grande]
MAELPLHDVVAASDCDKSDDMPSCSPSHGRAPMKALSIQLLQLPRRCVAIVPGFVANDDHIDKLLQAVNHLSSGCHCRESSRHHQT